MEFLHGQADLATQLEELTIVSTDETIELRKASKSKAASLATPVGKALLLVEERVFTVGERPIELASVLFKCDKIKLQLSK